ncbi:predicted protein [Paecilomyces variotii No. 5]|uniref:Aminoglycoside phosphotransferase domain-containing protein n=1 Tax=Byssochlamys spectabilis (strain No. 5 / NBRC 109023) TaxID=1356009 RepID=V5HSZ5_BYSSN|nr:predicted protein [Paecilomyces variotii No. 5]
MNLGLGAIELVAGSLFENVLGDNSNSTNAIHCVVEFKVHTTHGGRRGNRPYNSIVRRALEDLVPLIHSHYPLFEKIYVIRPCEEYLTELEIPECLLTKTTILSNRQDLAIHLGVGMLPENSAVGCPSTSNDNVRSQGLEDECTGESVLESTEKTDTEPMTQGYMSGSGESLPSISSHKSATEAQSEQTETEPRLIYSEAIGSPTIILDPEDLKTAEGLFPEKMGARLVFADSDMVAKFGHGVRLAEAEALHLVSTRTMIPVPKLLSAYILDGVGYIIMSYEEGESLENYWDRVSRMEQDRILAHLNDYVRQMRDIKGDFIGGLDGSPCRDGIFEAGYGDYQKYSYGPYQSEEDFNEGIVQALKDRPPPELLAREDEPDSIFFTSEYILYQTVRALKGHEIVFTHGDLHTSNILVRSDGTPVIVDWGLAGFWPEYWEFYRAMFNPPWRASWDRMVERIIPPYYVEYSIMKKVFAVAWN